jgi:hypothetical protein
MAGCRLLLGRCGFLAGLSESYCHKCLAEEGRSPEETRRCNESYFGGLMKLVCTAMLADPRDEEEVEDTYGTSRRDVIDKLFGWGVSRQEILEALLRGVRNGWDRAQALELAEEFRLSDSRRELLRRLAQAAPTGAHCVHRGDMLRLERCRSCRGHVRVKVFACAVHDECTLLQPITGAACCRTCPQFEPATFLGLTAGSTTPT